MSKIRIRVTQISYTTLEVDEPTPERAFEHVYMGGDFTIVDDPEFSHFGHPDYGTKTKWSLVNENGEDIEYVRIYSPAVGKFLWTAYEDSRPGYGY